MNTLLIVEDEPLLLKALFEKLASNFICTTASNGNIGLKLALDSHPDLILLDLVMPQEDGLTMLKKLRDDEWGKTAKVIVLTNLSDQRSVEEAKKLNVISYLIKANLKLDEVVNHAKTALGAK